jgi:dihydrofolate reductase
MPRAKASQPLRCSFCHKSQDVVAKLISSPSDSARAYICDECVGVCNSMLHEDAANIAQAATAETVLRTPLEEATLPAEKIIERIQRLEGKARSKLQPRNVLSRKVVLSLGISLDGCIARRNGAVDFLFMPKDYSMAPFFQTIDTAIMGRKTYDAALKTTGGKFVSPVKGQILYVFSRSSPSGERNGVIFTNQSPAKFMRELLKNPGKNIWLMGGGELAHEFLEADLVDELYLGVVPVLLGEGIPLFPGGFPQRDFRLIENKTYSQGLIALKYERSVQKSK